MKTAGIIAEYNPLHNGHQHHISETRAMTGCDHVIVVMSGDFVQRGEPAIADKLTRTQWALQAGADLVLELPVAYALSSAERFAFGGVKTLADTGVLTHLSFGSELHDIAALEQACAALQTEPEGFADALSAHLSLGKAFPRARYDALADCGAPQYLLQALRTPNSILALEYIRFLHALAPQANPVAVARRGAMHDSPAPADGFSSASAIRAALLNGEETAYSAMPMYVAGRYALGNVPLVSLETADTLIRYALLTLSPAQLKALPDVQEGFENVLYRAVRNTDSLCALLTAIKSKRYTLARCKRILLCALLQLDRDLLQLAMDPSPTYLRVLGFRRQSRALLTAIASHGRAPMLMRRSDIRRCTPQAQTLLQADMHAHAIYSLLLHEEHPAQDFDTPPIML